MQTRQPLVPLFPAVYHTHYAAVGWPPHHRLLFQDASQYLHQRLVGLVFGSQLGWMDAHPWPRLRDEFPAVAACFNAAARLRMRFGNALGHGS